MSAKTEILENVRSHGKCSFTVLGIKKAPAESESQLNIEKPSLLFSDWTSDNITTTLN